MTMNTFLRLHAVLPLLFCPLLAQADPRPPTAAAVLQPFVDRNEVAGAVVLVATKDEVLATETVGHADIAAGRRMEKDAMFWIASMTKPMTAAAFMMLVDEGRVNMEDPVEKYLPEFKGQTVIVEQDAEHVLLKKPQQTLRLHHLLSHTGGLAFSSAIEKPTLDMLPLETVVRSYAAAPLLHEPGSKYLYSNEGINTAGRIIEVVSGMKYADFMRQRLFDPLGMEDTTFFPSGEQVRRLAKTYKPNATKDGLEETRTGYLHAPYHDPARQPMPGGGLFSSARDVAAFGQMVLGGGVYKGRRLLSEESVKQMTSRQTPPKLDVSYGFGFAVDDDSFGHGGALSTNLTIAPSAGLLFVYLVQHAGFPGEGGKALGAFKAHALQLYGSGVK